MITWLGSLDAAARAQDLPPLDGAEQARARAFTSATAAERFGTLRQVQRDLLARLLEVDAERLLSSYECPECGPEAGHGRPGYRLAGRGSGADGPERRVAGLRRATTTAGPPSAAGSRGDGPAQAQRLSGVALSASRAGEWGAVVVVTEVERDFRIGLDLTLHEEMFVGFDRVALSRADRSWLEARQPALRTAGRAALWAAKEAVSKRDGHGLRKDPAAIEVLAAGRYLPGLVDLVAEADGLPPYALKAAVPEAAAAAFRTATA